MPFLLRVVLIALFAGISAADIRWRRIPDIFIYILLGIGILLLIADGELSAAERMWGAAAVSVPMAGLMFLFPGSFGGGDVKLMAAAGLVLGAGLILVGAAAGILFCGAYCMFLLIRRQAGRKTQLAFGPFLCMGMVFSMFMGEACIRWFFAV